MNWLRECYSEIWEKILNAISDSRHAVQMQALGTAIKLMAAEGKSPIDKVENVEYYFPLQKLKAILMKILSPDKDNSALINRFQEMSNYADASYFIWKCLPALCPKKQPQNMYITNLLEFIHKMPLQENKGLYNY